jgi:AraC-like DNA-binding protein
MATNDTFHSEAAHIGSPALFLPTTATLCGPALNLIKNWPQLAEAAHYRVNDLARLCGVSIRTLQRFCLWKTSSSPQRCLNDLRQKLALPLMEAGQSVKEVANQLGYKQASHFSREYKHFHGMPPSHVPSASRPRLSL